MTATGKSWGFPLNPPNSPTFFAEGSTATKFPYWSVSLTKFWRQRACAAGVFPCSFAARSFDHQQPASVLLSPQKPWTNNDNKKHAMALEFFVSSGSNFQHPVKLCCMSMQLNIWRTAVQRFLAEQSSPPERICQETSRNILGVDMWGSINIPFSPKMIMGNSSHVEHISFLKRISNHWSPHEDLLIDYQYDETVSLPYCCATLTPTTKERRYV